MDKNMNDPSRQMLSADPLVATLLSKADDLRSKKRAITIAMILVFIGAIATFIFGRGASTSSLWSNIEQFLPWSLVFVGGAAATARAQLQTVAQLAAAVDYKRALGPFILLLDDPNPDQKKLAEEVVIRLLPRITANDFQALSSEERSTLFNAARSTVNARYALSLIEAAKNFGDQTCIAPLEDFLHGSIRLRAAEADRARTSAQMALADIRMRVARAHIEREINVTRGQEAIDTVGDSQTVEHHLRSDV
jgi:hypothetical protein